MIFGMIAQAVAMIAAAAIADSAPPLGDACLLLDSARTRAVIGADMIPSDTPMPSTPDMPECTRIDKGRDRYVSVLVRMPPSVDAKASYQAGKSQLTADKAFAALPGVGDDAYSTQMSLGTETLTYVFILKGDRFVSLTLTGFKGAELVALAKAIADQV